MGNKTIFCNELKINTPHIYFQLSSNAEPKNQQQGSEDIKIAKEAIKKICSQYQITEECIELTFAENRDSEKAIEIPLEGNEECKSEIFNFFIIRLMENAEYYINVSNNCEVKLSSIRGEFLKKLPTGGWRIFFWGELFYGDIEVYKEGNLVFSMPFFVYPKKLRLREAELLIKDLLEMHTALILDLSEPTGLTIVTGEYGKMNPIQKLKFIQYLFEKRNLKGILNSIIENPDKKIEIQETFKEIQDVDCPSVHKMPELILQETAVKRGVDNKKFDFKVLNKGYNFTKVYEEKIRITYDTFANRFIKFFLKFLRQELNTIEACLSSFITEEHGNKENGAEQNQSPEEQNNKAYIELFKNYFLPKIKEIRDKHVNRFLNRDFFKEVSDLKYFSASSQVLLKDYRYQNVFLNYLKLIKGVHFSDELEKLFRDPIRNIPELYEYWCFLKSIHLLRQRVKIIKFTPAFREDSPFCDVLVDGCNVKFDNDIILIFNKYYSNRNSDEYSYSVDLRPDFTLKIGNNLILLDAKYRIDWIEELRDDENKFNEREKEERRGTFKKGDIYKMHTYREAIRQNINKNPQPLWVVALYPGTESAIYKEDRTEEQVDLESFLDELIKLSKEENGKDSANKGGVGAIPLKPKE